MISDQARYEEMLVGPIQRFDQRRDMFRRTRYDPDWVQRAASFYGPIQPRDRDGYRQEEQALCDAAWHLEDDHAQGCRGSGHPGLYAWHGPDPESARMPADLRPDLGDPVATTRKVKQAARFFGASLAGVCRLDERWLYSHVSDDLTGEHRALEIPEGIRYAVAMAVEMDYALIQTSPTAGAAAATGLAYSQMAFVAGLLARFIRDLGYQAIPCGNDTALSIPIAVEAGLGELGRNGILITEAYGPRVRLCKVFTDLPLVPDGPRFFGVEAFCRVCLRCAEDCPSRAISFGEKTSEALNISTNPGILKWPVNAEQCFKYWIANGVDCANCTRVCPFNKAPGWLHDLVRLGVRHVPWLDPVLVWSDRRLGYGRQRDPASIWT